MLPPLLTHDIIQGLKQFLITGFEPSNPFFKGLMQRYVADEQAWLKGPFLQLGLPFRTGSQGAGFFPGLTMQHAGYVHQEKSWERLASDKMAANTLVATGTGSGKTECFLYPLLVHAARMRAAGGDQAKGIKALVIYPMNALATDQARRFAEAVAEFPAFAGLRVGLFVGGQSKGQSGNPVMTATEVITDREVMRQQPPDILLTNYKMLDYLLIRPKDRQLWAHNTPTTLRYVVVDELHTFDGAQGTDLALLLRRLRARLQTPEGQLICAGTSATLGGNADTSPLREYARQVMGGEFPPESVITEDRRTLAEFLDGASTEHVFEFAEDHLHLLDPSRYANQEEAIKAWFGVFFPALPLPTDVSHREFRAELGTHLKSHLLVEKLLKLLDGRVRIMGELVEELRGSLPTRSRVLAEPILAALVALLGWARDPAVPALPLLTLRQQLWLRELRRMVAQVQSVAQNVSLVSSVDLKAKPGGVFLPLVQCTECRTTGWLGVKADGGAKVSSDLESIYNAWFDRRPEIMRLYPKSGFPAAPQVECAQRFLCGECGHVQGKGEQCTACGCDSLVEVMQVTATTTSERNNAVFNWHDLTCPTCASRDRLILLGARNATLGAQVIEHSWASPFNDDKKLIAFSDSVQDAAHRAGFFSGRTYGHNTRIAIAQALHELTAAQGTVPWTVFLQQLPELWLKRFGRERFVSEFIGPNMLWLQDWDKLAHEDESLGQNSRLPERVARRLAWQAFVEFTYLNRRGRSLERVGLATVALDLEAITAVAERLRPKLAEQLGLRQLSQATLWQWIWGFMTHLRQRGAVSHPELSNYAQDGNIFGLVEVGERRNWMPSMGTHTPRPIWLSLGQHRAFDRISSQSGNWYFGWMTTLFERDEVLLARNIVEPIYQLLISELCSEGLLVRAQSDTLGDSVALNAERLQLTHNVCHLLTNNKLRPLCVPLAAAEQLMDLPCLEAFTERYTQSCEQTQSRVQGYLQADVRRVISAEHTGLLERQPRERLEQRFKARPEQTQPWYENLLSATPTLEMGVDIGSLSSVLLCSVPPSQASYLQRVGRAGRRDGNALATTLADGSSPHDLYFFNEPSEMLSGEVLPPGIFLQAAEVLRRQLLAYCLDDWVGTGIDDSALPEKTSTALDAIHAVNERSFPFSFMSHMQVNEPRLLASFIAMLGDDIDDRVRQRLQFFMQGGEGEDSLRMKLFRTLEELGKERALYKKRQSKLKADISNLKAKPQDDVTIEEIDSLDRLRGMAQQQAKAINEKDLLNTLTDAGLIPNYAFPEAGIQLKSMLWRKKQQGEEGSGNYITLPAMNFERPASSALSEFAPQNRFFANQRKVEINQIDMQLASPERWRMCPSCHHMQNLESQPDSDSECPRCHDVMWTDAAQVMTLLRFKQAVANSDDSKVRIDDSSEDREPKFYQRQLLVDFKPEDIEVAWSLKSESLPFGFEFIRHAQFRDINFGERGKGSETLKVANQTAIRSGFKLCKYCGMVQKPPRRKRDAVDEPVQTHAIDCEKRKSEDPLNLIECLYLYREFESEALRILVPFTKVGMDERVVQSFMAAVQLGLKRRFGGKVDHLRMTTHEEPGKDNGPARHYIMLYDSVPGGTGYLHQLLSQDAQTLSDVLRMASEQLNSCRCNAEPDKDGCYSCLYQYRLGRAMNQVSRDCARDILDELLGSLDMLERVDCISDIEINPQFDSLLESRFIASLPRLGSELGQPKVRLVKDVVKGKSGYQLTVGSEQYWVEMQVELAEADGIAVACKPDCVIWPKLSQSPRRPIAVFCDGWAYHQPVLASDALKRSALVGSGRFWVWSVTWDDVEAALDGKSATALGSPFGSHVQNNLPPNMTVDKTLLLLHSIALLLHWLASPTPNGVDAFMGLQLINMQGLATQLVCLPTDAEKLSAMTAELGKLWQFLPSALQEKPQRASVAGSPFEAEPRIRLYWPHSWASAGSPAEQSTGLFVLNDSNTDDKQLHTQWRHWLSWYNHLQVLPGMLLATSKSLASGDFSALSKTLGGKPATPGQGEDSAWQAIFNQVVKSVKPGLEQLVTLGVVPPDAVGYELPSLDGDVLAEAELAWVEKRLVLLLENQDDYAPEWQTHGWQCVIAAGEEWPEQLAALINA
ncbi:MAG: DEAD/DEAH box helicase [Gammaproteobacteria bacterium]|nr:DEAD/DEAH box helicase [Gammaproteobacteria bacterium]MBU2154724.1 DEAD/DEAH box helicase [Gammaproteobacteria bacterium]MBU2257234.1 DEAD/DEAH box helicase [Gammaproteobacteria bacterium]MBU2293266.1 DEAD/DEAH box helicase [Gammaproteobacteria bacterium]